MKIEIKPQEIKELVPMSASIVRLVSKATDLKTPISELTQIIEYDEAMTVNLLRVVNSVWGGAVVPILTVQDAIVRMGTAHILQICIGKQISSPMSNAIPGYELGEHELWRHSLAGALIAEHLNAFLFKPVPRLTFTAALMHDIGKVLLARHMGYESLIEIKRLMVDESLSFKHAEHKLLGTNHAEVGGSIARYWKLPKQLVEAIEFHHDPDSAQNGLVDAVHVSNRLSKRITPGMEILPMTEATEKDEATKRLGLSTADMDTICEKTATELQEAEKAYVS